MKNFSLKNLIRLAAAVLCVLALSSCGSESSSSVSSSSSAASSSASSSSFPSTNKIETILESDIKNDPNYYASLIYSTDNFGEYIFVVEKSGTYKFNAVNITGAGSPVSWDIYVLDKEYEYNTRYLMRQYKPTIKTDESVKLYKGQHVYCICSLNQYNYVNTPVQAYLKIRLTSITDEQSAPAHQHDYKVKDSHVFCEKQGYIIYECACGDTYVAEVPATGHTYVKTVVPPTCEEAGRTDNVCSVCNHSFVSDEVKPLGHTFDPAAKTTVMNEKSHSFVCTTCKKEVSADHAFEIIAYVTPLKHSDGRITYSATFIKTCSVCGYSSSAESEYPDHLFPSYEFDRATGTLTFTCDLCGDISYTVKSVSVSEPVELIDPEPEDKPEDKPDSDPVPSSGEAGRDKK